MRTMLAARRMGQNKIRIVPVEQGELEPGEARIRVAWAGICGSDVDRFADSDKKWDSVILGHECSGILDEVNLPESVQPVEGINTDSRGEGLEWTPAASRPVPGMKVSLAPLVPCHGCEYCSRGDFSLCSRYSFIGSRQQGCFAEYVRVPIRNLVPLPDTVPLEAGALIEPMTVCLHPLLRLKTLLGATVAVFGLGTLGLLAVQILKAMGARRIIGIDPVPEKTGLAGNLGATETLTPTDMDLLCKDEGICHVVLECSGTLAAKKAAIRASRGRGAVLLLGTSPRDIHFEAGLFERVTRKELRLEGSWMNYSAPWPGREWATAVWMIQKGLVQTRQLVTHRIALKNFQQALNVLQDPDIFSLKILVGSGGNPE